MEWKRRAHEGAVLTHLDVREEEEMEKNLAPASLAIALPIIVLPVPATHDNTAAQSVRVVMCGVCIGWRRCVGVVYVVRRVAFPWEVP